MAGITDEEAKRIAKEAVKETLLTLGIDVSNPISVLETQADLNHVRVWRKSVEVVQRQTLIATVGIIISGIAGAIYMAFRGGHG